MLHACAGKRSPFAESTAAPPPTPASPLTPASLAWSSRTGSLNPSQTSSRATSKAPSRAASLQSKLLLSNGPCLYAYGSLSKAHTGNTPQHCPVPHVVMAIWASQSYWPSMEQYASSGSGGLFGKLNVIMYEMCICPHSQACWSWLLSSLFSMSWLQRVCDFASALLTQLCFV